MTALVWKPAVTFTGVIDVSHNNGLIKWSLVPATILLVFVKATQGTNFIDPQYRANVEGAQDTGRLVVPYHFLTAADPLAQAAYFAKTAGLAAGKPAMIDWEQMPPSMARAPITLMEIFTAAVAKTIARGALCYHGMYDLTSPTINKNPWFIPKYGPAPQGPKYLFWQDRPNLRVAGVPNPTDHSIFSGTEAELRTWHKTGIMPKGFT